MKASRHLQRQWKTQDAVRTIGLFRLAGLADSGDLDQPGGLSASHEVTHRMAGFPFGAAVAEIEVDPDTGETTVVEYSAVDDVGRAVNPLILHGQTHGGIGQGIGQALLERCAYDPAGQLLSGSLMDYSLPRATDAPTLRTVLTESPSRTNRWGSEPEEKEALFRPLQP